MKRSIPFFAILFLSNLSSFSQSYTTDVLVVGGGTGGTAAGIQAARMKVRTIIAEPTPWLGGMLTAAGVCATDGNDALHTGLWEEFRRQLFTHYGTKNLGTGWVSNTLFEPHVGDSIFKALCTREKDVLTVLYGLTLQRVIKNKNTITGTVFSNGKGKQVVIYARICIDATELGDVLALSGTTYDAGMEDAGYSGESIAPGRNHIIQDLTWAAILKDFGKGADRTIPRPPGYDSTRFFNSCLSKYCKDSAAVKWSADKMLNYGKIIKGKYMLNWPLNGNDYYLNVLEDNYKERERKYALAKNHTLQFIYYIQKELGYRNLGLAEDEFPTPDRLPFIPYNRESRRLKGLVRLTNDYLVRPYEHPGALYRTGIAVGNYPVDHHHKMNPAAPVITFTPILPYTIALGCLIPERTDGLIVAEKNISVSNIANGTTRLQPVVLLTGQAAGALAAYCIGKHIQPRKASVRDIQTILLNAKCDIMPFTDVQPGDINWEEIQRTGATGILKGEGKSEGWEHKMYFYPDSLAAYDEFKKGLEELGINYMYDRKVNSKWLVPDDIIQVQAFLLARKKIPVKEVYNDGGLRIHNFDETELVKPLNRSMAAYWIDRLLHLFTNNPVTLTGKLQWEGLF